MRENFNNTIVSLLNGELLRLNIVWDYLSVIDAY